MKKREGSGGERIGERERRTRERKKRRLRLAARVFFSITQHFRDSQLLPCEEQLHFLT